MSNKKNTEGVVIHEKLATCPGIIYFPGRNEIEISGRSIPENPHTVFDVLNDWLRSFLKDNSELTIIIRLEYINSGSAKYFFETLIWLSDEFAAGKKIMLRWLYDEDDESMRDLGEHFRENLGIPIAIEEIK